MNIYIRPLREDDALVSCRWRNDPDVWILTGSRPDRFITEEIEIEWVRRVLRDCTSRRYAICIAENHEYVGNVQLTGITDNEAEFHIFIGEKKYWGKGISTQATGQILGIAFGELSLSKVYLYVNNKNTAAIKSYEKNGFLSVADNNESLKMEVLSSSWKVMPGNNTFRE